MQTEKDKLVPRDMAGIPVEHILFCQLCAMEIPIETAYIECFPGVEKLMDSVGLLDAAQKMFVRYKVYISRIATKTSIAETIPGGLVWVKRMLVREAISKNNHAKYRILALSKIMDIHKMRLTVQYQKARLEVDREKTRNLTPMQPADAKIVGEGIKVEDMSKEQRLKFVEKTHKKISIDGEIHEAEAEECNDE